MTGPDEASETEDHESDPRSDMDDSAQHSPACS